MKARLRRPLAVVLYAAFIGLLLASYVAPAQEIITLKSEIPTLKEELTETRAHNDEQRRTVEALKTPEGIEKAARQRYGMVEPGETVYVIPEE